MGAAVWSLPSANGRAAASNLDPKRGMRAHLDPMHVAPLPRPAPPAPSRAATGFDPIGFISDPAKKEEMQMKELANGRLAMFAFGGAVTQAVLTGNTFPWLYSQ